MKKYKKGIIIAIVVALLFPYGHYYLKDGGSQVWKSAVYSVTKVHRISETGFIEGWEISILGFEIINTGKAVKD